MKSTLACFDPEGYISDKWDNYFKVYDRYLNKYVGTDVTFVEIGVKNGGSLFMWRNFFGEKARIIGIDLNPGAKQFEDHGFEIFIGDQNSVEFWTDFYKKVGKVDAMLDDGGHRNDNQIITTYHALNNLSDGGVLLVEDVHTSYMKGFGNPSDTSFLSYCKLLADGVQKNENMDADFVNVDISDRIDALHIHEGVIVFDVVAKRKIGERVELGKKTIDAVDFRFHSEETEIEEKASAFGNLPLVKYLFKKKWKLRRHAIIADRVKPFFKTK
jgi:hypothetical protein